MRKIFVALILVYGLASGIPTEAADLYQQNQSVWKGQTKEITGREYKILIDPAKTNPDMGAAFKDIWAKAKSVAAEMGITMTEREKKPFELSPTVKTFFDTPSLDLWKKGYLIRVTTNFKNGYPVSPMRIAVKSINGTFTKVLGAKLETKGVAGKASAEDNVCIGKDGQLSGYVEKGVNFNLGRAELGEMNLAEFGAYVPELLKLGLPADTRLQAIPAFGVRCRPGFIKLDGLEQPLAVSMEAWSHTEGGAPFVYDFSFGYDGDFSQQAVAHKAGEKLTLALYKKLGDSLGVQNAWRWNGSKVRMLLNQPL